MLPRNPEPRSNFVFVKRQYFSNGYYFSIHIPQLPFCIPIMCPCRRRIQKSADFCQETLTSVLSSQTNIDNHPNFSTKWRHLSFFSTADTPLS